MGAHLKTTGIIGFMGLLGWIGSRTPDWAWLYLACAFYFAAVYAGIYLMVKRP
jgi:hypothetical protein